jgi:hypothetical protein
MVLNMSLINQIDFANHDGVNRAMINDFMRNQFYDNIFQGRVQGQHCIDIGFGTGLLSMLAIKHGAESIVAYESDDARYELGQTIIQRLGLEQKIQLIHNRFDYTMIDQYPDVTVAFSETVNGNLWQEGLFNSLPRKRRIEFLPGQYFLEMYACAVPDSFAQGLIAPHINTGFNPGVDIDSAFIEAVNQIGFPGNNVAGTVLTAELNRLNPGVDTEWGWIPYLRLCVNNGQLVSGYCLDANNFSLKFVDGVILPVDFDQHRIQLVIDTTLWRNSSVILVPRAGISHGSHRLMLDTGHWGPTSDPVVLHRPTSNVTITHSFHSGRITYTNG